MENVVADEPEAPVQIEAIPSVAGGVAAIASAQAPFIYFDGAPNFGFLNSVCNISLEALRYTPVGDKVLTDRVVVAHLRMNLEALEHLKRAIAGIEQMIKPPEAKAIN